MPIRRFTEVVDRFRFAIATGQLKSGTALPPLRSAAAEFGMHLHTVRRAYHELAADGLVRVDPRRGAVVLATASSRRSLDAFLQEMLAEARTRFGAAPNDVEEALLRLRTTTPASITVTECSLTLAESIARQIERRWLVDAVPHVLGAGALPSSRVVTTYFHYREVSTALAERPDDAAFVRIAVAKDLISTLQRACGGGTLRRLVIRETDAQFGHEVAGALRYALRGRVEIDVIVPSRDEPVNAPPLGHWTLLSPRHRDVIGPVRRLPARVLLLDYDVDAEDLDALGEAFGWSAAQETPARKTPRRKPRRSGARVEANR